MFTRLRVEDYQSIEKADIALEPFTVIVGENRAGKSALLRALIGLFTNKTGNGFIRYGRKQSRVTVNTAEGDEIEWTKTKTSAAYSLNAAGYSKMAGAVPQDIVQAIGIRSVEVDSTTTIWPQLHRENDTVFLIKPHLSAGQAARVIAKLTKLDIVVKAQQLCKAILRSLSLRKKEAENNMSRTDEELQEFVGIEEDGEFLEDLEAKRKELGTDIAEYAGGKLALDDLEEAGRDCDQYLPSADEIEEIEDDIDTITEVAELVQVLEEAAPPAVPELEPMKSMLKEFEEILCIHELLELASDEGSLVYSKLEESKRNREQLMEELEQFAGTECPVCGATL